MRKTKLITFDLDDTLWNNKPVMINAEMNAWNLLIKLWPAFSQHFEKSDLHKIRIEVYQNQPELRHQITELRRQSLILALTRASCDYDQAISISNQVMDEFVIWRHQVQYFSEVETLLASLSEKYALAAVTNGNVDIKRLSIGRYFQFGVRSEQYKSSKPDAVLFQKAMELAGVNPAETVHVGDCLNADIYGARQLGITTVWFNPDRKPQPEDNRPDWVIHSLEELPACLAEKVTAAHQ